MVAKKRAKPESDSPEAGTQGGLRRLTDIAALLLVKGEKPDEKVRVLASVGYSPVEISGLLGISSNAASVAMYRLKKKKK